MGKASGLCVECVGDRVEGCKGEVDGVGMRHEEDGEEESVESSEVRGKARLPGGARGKRTNQGK